MRRVDVHALVGTGFRIQIGERLVVAGRPDPDLAPFLDPVQQGGLGVDVCRKDAQDGK